MTYEDEVCDMMPGIEETENGFKMPISIPSAFFKFIIGKKGETKRKIENETCTSIWIPRQGQEGDIGLCNSVCYKIFLFIYLWKYSATFSVIQGRDRKGIISAKTRIDILVESGRQKLPFTHFLSIPVQSPDIRDGFEDFKKQVLDKCKGVSDTCSMILCYK